MNFNRESAHGVLAELAKRIRSFSFSSFRYSCSHSSVSILLIIIKMVEANAPDKSKDTATADLDKLVSLVNEAIDANIADLQQGIHHIDFQVQFATFA